MNVTIATDRDKETSRKLLEDVNTKAYEFIENLFEEIRVKYDINPATLERGMDALKEANYKLNLDIKINLDFKFATFYGIRNFNVSSIWTFFKEANPINREQFETDLVEICANLK